MNVNRLKALLQQVTILRSPLPKRPPNVIDLFKPPDDPTNQSLVDCFLAIISVDTVRAQQVLVEVIKILTEYPKMPQLLSGPSYLQVGKVLGGRKVDKESALRLFAFGHALGLWTVQTPADINVSETKAELMAIQGHITMTGFDPMEYLETLKEEP